MLLAETIIRNSISWSSLINLIIQNYFIECTTIALIANDESNFVLSTPSNGTFTPFINIQRQKLNESFGKDIYDFAKRQKHYVEDNKYFDDLILKVSVAIESSHAECFIVFNEDIQLFVEGIYRAAMYSIWRSTRNRFLFAYRKDINPNDFLEHRFFKDQHKLVVVEYDDKNDTIFNIKTNVFIGSKFDRPQDLYLLNMYDARAGQFQLRNIDLYPDKLNDMNGRELVIAAFDYRPMMTVDFNKQPLTRDHADDNPNGTVNIDGTEIRLAIVFCQIYNCNIEGDTTDKGEWGFVFPNITGYGVIGMVLDQTVDAAYGGMYTWYNLYQYLDISAFIGRSGVTLMVPKPILQVSWDLPFKPFQSTLWLGVMACLLLETIALLVTRHFEIYQTTESLEGDNISWIESFQFGYITTLKLFISQSSTHIVKSNSVRTVLFSCYMIDIIITSIYGGGLAAILTIPTYGEAADSLDRLYRHQLPWAATTANWVEAIRNDISDPKILSISQNFQIFTLDQIVEYSKTKNMGYPVERMTFGHFGNINFLTSESLDHLKLMVDDIYFQFTITPVPRLWSLIDKYNDFVYNYHSSGFSKYWEWKATADSLNANDQQQIQQSMKTWTDTGPLRLGLPNFSGLILVWIVGIIISILFFLGEIIYHRQKKYDIEFN